MAAKTTTCYCSATVGDMDSKKDLASSRDDIDAFVRVVIKAGDGPKTITPGANTSGFCF